MCDELVEVLTEYLDGTLGAHDRARLDAHLGVCDDCREYLDQFRTTLSLVGRVDTAALSADTRAGLLRAFRAARG
jgi:predicted anti-sigma-YlaC factor YlaD